MLPCCCIVSIRRASGAISLETFPNMQAAGFVVRFKSLGCCAQMYVVAVGMILGAMNRLPIKLPRRGPGRRHSSGGSLQQTVTFDDVAGVDEAKEELSEIVVWSPHLQTILVAMRAPMHNRQHPWPQATRGLFSRSCGSCESSGLPDASHSACRSC